ncbi:hypothetical protein FV139_02880 [Parahaliea maris]|uniref:SnoaL-like domain-containing protein n=1 Tax=Parahaliea maris TaxID=2716870 RepID=A0A5C9AA18_9GAMM|nr:nuclear transport factor 2 family protein [Parahaliea maris]TXS96447.1 hypothetical protein FV139_02880 [Parahaliea maris]
MNGIPNNNSDRNIQLVYEYLEALNCWDFDRLTELTTEDVVFEVPFRPVGFERTTSGRANYIALLIQASTVMIDGSENLYDIEVDTLSSNPDELLASYRSAMKLRSGADYRNEYLARFSVRDGKVCRFVEYTDPILLFTAMGGKVDSVANLTQPELLPQSLHTTVS